LPFAICHLPFAILIRGQRESAECELPIELVGARLFLTGVKSDEAWFL